MSTVALEHTAFLERYEAVVADDAVVEELDAEELAAFVQALGDAPIFRAGRAVAAGMVVCDG